MKNGLLKRRNIYDLNMIMEFQSKRLPKDTNVE